MRGLVVLRLLLLACGACRERAAPPPTRTASLVDYLQRLAGSDEATRTREVRSWRFDAAGWRQLVVEPYRGIYADYVRGFDARVPALVAQLASPGVVTARAHYAGDPGLTTGEACTRWALPVQFASQVAELATVPIDAVFVRDAGRWRAITGLDAVLGERAGAIDPACARRLALAGPIGRCTELGWVIADAALRADRPRFAHACQLAESLCPKE